MCACVCACVCLRVRVCAYVCVRARVCAYVCSCVTQRFKRTQKQDRKVQARTQNKKVSGARTKKDINVQRHTRTRENGWGATPTNPERFRCTHKIGRQHNALEKLGGSITLRENWAAASRQQKIARQHRAQGNWAQQLITITRKNSCIIQKIGR